MMVMVTVMVMVMTVSSLEPHDELGVQGKSGHSKAVCAEHTESLLQHAWSTRKAEPPTLYTGLTHSHQKLVLKGSHQCFS